jgi:geranylgeranyl pyrophosphate synthase
MQAPVFFTKLRSEIDQGLEQILNTYSSPSRLADAIRYSSLLGGKRVRPILTILSAQCLGSSLSKSLYAALSVELIHAYSLVHDDLPAMDDDDLRRGQPTCHIAFDEATAILAGDALQALAFEILSDQGNGIDDAQKVALIKILAQASGAQGMVLGQAIDLEAVGQNIDLAALENMHRHKTGKLIEASVMLGAICAEASPEESSLLQDYARHLGLAFQVQDDILDVTGDTKTIGKTAGADSAANKPTYVSLLGLQGAGELLQALNQKCLQSLERLSGRDTSDLRALTDFVIHRAL